MMGALDEVGGVPAPIQAPQTTAVPPQAIKNASSSQRGRVAHAPRSRSQNHALEPEDTENQEDESVAEMVSFKVIFVAA